MSYSTQFYVVDIQSLVRAVSSNDEALFDAIISGQAAEIKNINDWFEEDIVEFGLPRVEEALTQIINGKIDVPEDGEFQYGYALELLCMHFGEKLKEADGIGFLDELPFGPRLLEAGIPVSIPKAPDFPEIGHLPADQVVQELERLTSCEDEDTRQYKMILQYARDKGKGIVSFTY